MVFQDTIKLAPHGIGASDITDIINAIIKDSKISVGTCQLFVHNSQSSLIINDTADETTKKQTVDFLAQLAPSSDGITNEIDRNMEAVPQAMLSTVIQSTLSFPVCGGKSALGT